MSTSSNFDNLARAWLDEGPTELSDFALDAALDEIHLTRQRRAPRVPWRFPTMPALTRATGIAAVALVAVVGAGGFIYLTSNSPGGAGASATPVPTASAAQSVAPTLPMGIPGWKSFTSTIYDFTISYPEDWSLFERARWRWGASEDPDDENGHADKFASPEQSGQEQIGLLVWQMPAPAGLYVGSDEGGLNISFATLCDSLRYESCGVLIPPKKLCLGPLGLAESQEGCVRTLIGSIGKKGEETPHAFVIDPKTNLITVFWVARVDSFPTAERYGGATALLTAIVSQLKIE